MPHASISAINPQRTPISCRLVQSWKLAAVHPQLAVLDLVFIFVESARWWSRRVRAVFIKCSTVTWTHEKVRLLKPADWTSQVRAVDGKDLKRLALRPPHPARNVGGWTIPRTRIRVTGFCQACLVLREIC